MLDDDRDHLAYYPEAFSPESRRLLAECFPDAILATEADASLRPELRQRRPQRLHPAGAAHLRTEIAAVGYRPVSIDLR